MSTVNSQITDAVTQTNVSVLAEAPAFALSTLYQTLAHSTGILFENAVAAQQQQNTLAQAAANQGVMQIYSLDTTAAAGASSRIVQGGQTDEILRLLASLNSFQTPPAASAAHASAAVPMADAAPADTGAAATPAAASPDSARLLADLQASVDGLHRAIGAINQARQDGLTKILQNAATSAVLAAMVREPEKTADYEAALAAIRKLG